MENLKKIFFLAFFCIVINCVSSAPNKIASSINDNFYEDVRQLIKRKIQEGVDADIEPETAINAPTPVLVENWPRTRLEVGQVVGVAFDYSGLLAVFHRYERNWDFKSFNETHHYQKIHVGPIHAHTVYLVDPEIGRIEYGWLAGIFYMPHGMTVDVHGNYWLSDVALHQVFKFKPYVERPTLVLGRRFEPGSSINHLCMPTSVAVATTGEIFVADGYCNERVIKYNAAGQVLRTIPQPPEFLSLQVPHGITLIEQLDLLCIADRENMRVVCPKAGLRSSLGEGQPAATIQEPDLGRVFDVASYGDLVFAINGPTAPNIPVRGFTIDPRSETIIGHWGEFKNPHSIAVSINQSVLYVAEIGPNIVRKFVLV